MATAAKYKVYNGTSWVEYVFPVASHSHTITANATDGIFDITGTNGTNAVTYALAPYSSQQNKLSFDTSGTAPTGTDRLNLNGYFYATKLYSGGFEVLTSHQSLANYVTLDGAQTITGAKTFSAGTEFTGSGEIGAGSKTTVYADGITNTQSNTLYTYLFPAKNGTLALTSDLPIMPIIKQYGMGPITASGTSCTLTFTVYSYDSTKYSITTSSDFSSKIVNELLANAIIDSSHTITGTVNISGTSYTISSYNKSTKTLTLSNSSTLNLSTITSAYFYTYPYMANLGCDTSNLRTSSTSGYYFTAGTNGSISAKGLYEHNVRIYNSTSNFSVTFQFTDNYSSAYTYTTISYYLYNRGFTGNTTVCPANGVYGTSTALNMITGVYGYSNSSYYWLYFRYIPLVSYSSSTATINNTVSGESSTSITLTSSFTVQDKVRQL